MTKVVTVSEDATISCHMRVFNKGSIGVYFHPIGDGRTPQHFFDDRGYRRVDLNFEGFENYKLSDVVISRFLGFVAFYGDIGYDQVEGIWERYVVVLESCLVSNKPNII